MKKGFFVSFEGIDGSGKSTQLSLLGKMLEEQGYPVLCIREPGGTNIGEKIRSILLDKDSMEMSKETELLLFEAARAQIVREIIFPALEENKIVLCDRFFDATVAYQGYARGLHIGDIERLNLFASGNLEPDITFLLDFSSEEALKRRNNRCGEEDRVELAGKAFMEQVRDGYLQLAKNNQRIAVVDANASEKKQAEYIADKFWEVIHETNHIYRTR